MYKITVEKKERLVFFILLILWLIPVWSVDYFLTGDGPCHLYNSKILLDWWRGIDKDMYGFFMKLNPNIDPNWLTNIIQAPLLYIFPYNIAEKVFFTIYNLLFVLGFRYLIKQIAPQAIFISCIGFLFVWNNLVFKGFLNNCLSIAVWFWIVGIWWKYRNASFAKAVLIVMLVSLFGYISHPIGFVYSSVMIFCLLLSMILSASLEGGFRLGLQLGFKHILRLSLAYLPVIMLFIYFFYRRSWSADSISYNKDTWLNIITLPTLIAYNYNEKAVTTIIGIICALLMIVSLVYRFKNRGIRETDGLFLFMLIAVLSVMYPPSGLLGGLDAPRRIIFIPSIAFVFCMLTLSEFSKRLKAVITVFVSVISITLLFLRLRVEWKISNYVGEIISCQKSLMKRRLL